MASVSHQALLMRTAGSVGIDGWVFPLSVIPQTPIWREKSPWFNNYGAWLAAIPFAASGVQGVQWAQSQSVPNYLITKGRRQFPSIIDPSSYSAAWLSSAAGVAACDSHFSRVVLLVGFEGADASTGAPGMTDESPAAHGTATVLGDAQIDTAQFKFGASSLLLDGSGDLITYASNADWDFGSGPFTVECWIRPANTTAGVRMIVGVWSNTTLAWILYQSSSSLEMNINATVGGNTVILGGGALAAVTQQAVCVDYDGSKYRMYINGVMVDSFATPKTITAGTKPLSIGANSDAAQAYNGYIDELRITKGVARYASDAGYAPATLAFPRGACAAATPASIGWQQPSPAPISRSGIQAPSIVDAASYAQAWISPPAVFVTWDPNTASAVTFSGGNLVATNTGTTSSNQGAHVNFSLGKTTGKRYIEMTLTTLTQGPGTNLGVGIGTTVSTYSQMGANATHGNMCYQSGNLWADGATGATLGTRSAGDVIGIAIDLDNRKIWFKKVSGTPGDWNGDVTADPATNVAGRTIPTGTMVPFCTFGGTGGHASNVITFNAGAASFVSAAPSGFTSGWTIL